MDCGRAGQGAPVGPLGPEFINRWYEVLPGGVSSDLQRFLLLKWGKPTDAESVELVLVQNWFDELQRLVPTP